MLLIPLPFVATCFLIALLAFILRGGVRDAGVWGFAGLIALYAVQSVLMGLRWGYGWMDVAPLATMVAALMPSVAWLAYMQMVRPVGWRSVRHGFPVVLIWGALALMPDTVDALMILTYIGYGTALLLQAWRGLDHLALARIDGITGSHRAMWVTGSILIASGLADAFIVVDFIRTGGQSVGIVIVTAQVLSVVLVACAAVIASGSVAATQPEATPDPAPAAPDSALADQITELFTQQKIYRDLELNLRRIARRLGVPDRAISTAINRTHGISVSQYVNNFRVAEAQHFLTTTDQPVIQVGLAAGFLTKSNFNREFRRVTGQSPSAYRANT